MDSKRILRELRERIVEAGGSLATFGSYGAALKIFFEYFPTKEHPTHINESELVAFLAWVRENRGPSQERACFWALAYLYKNIEHQPHKMDHIEKPKVHHRIEIPPSGDEVLAAIDKITDPKHRAIVQLIYSTGARLSEAAKLKIADVDSKNMIIHIRFGKGNKSRIVPLHPVLLETLRAYLRDMQSRNRMPKEYLFESEKTPGYHISRSTVYRICVDEVGVRTHLIRHAFATEFHKLDKDLIPLRDLLGHSNTRTTEGYVHYNPEDIRRLPSVLDKSAQMLQSNLIAA